MQISRRFRINQALWGLLLLVSFSACKKDDVRPEFPIGTNEHVNSWILDSMQVYYYWNRSLPKQPNFNQTSLDFFASIKNTEDRFSLLVTPNNRTTYDPTLASAFGVDLVAVETGGQVQVLVLLVVPGSNAANAGIKRGDRIEAINNQPAATANPAQLIDESIQSGVLSLQVIGQPTPITLSATYPFERPLYTAKVIKTGAAKTAYLFLNSFRSNRLQELKTAFTDFKGGQATELILDMRYNVGGEVSVAALLAAMIAPVSGTDVFAEYRGNANAGTKNHSFDKELSYIGETVNGLTSYRLHLQKMYILTGRHTASSAELLANNLSPYIEVIRIGETTLGKDMASFEIRDKRSPVQISDWIIHPLVYKLYNSRGEGGYDQGLSPDIAVNELAGLPLKPFGDETDPLIARALAQISSKQATAPKSAVMQSEIRVLMDSRDALDELSNMVIVND